MSSINFLFVIIIKQRSIIIISPFPLWQPLIITDSYRCLIGKSDWGGGEVVVVVVVVGVMVEVAFSQIEGLSELPQTTVFHENSLTVQHIYIIVKHLGSKTLRSCSSLSLSSTPPPPPLTVSSICSSKTD